MDVRSPPPPPARHNVSHSDDARRIGNALVELRRGGASTQLRDFFFGADEVLDQGQMDALDLLDRRDRTMKGMAERLRIDPSSATRAVQRIVNDGLAERVASPDDGRVVLVRITDKGRAKHATVAQRRDVAMQRIMEAFDPGERPMVAEVIERLTAAIDGVVAAPVDHR